MFIHVAAVFLISTLGFSREHCLPIREALDLVDPVPGIHLSHFEWDRYEPKAKKKTDKVAIVLPGLGGAVITDRWSAKSLCNH